MLSNVLCLTLSAGYFPHALPAFTKLLWQEDLKSEQLFWSFKAIYTGQELFNVKLTIILCVLLDLIQHHISGKELLQ